MARSSGGHWTVRNRRGRRNAHPEGIRTVRSIGGDATLAERGCWQSADAQARRAPTWTYFVFALSASAASSAVGISPPAFWAMLMSDSLLPKKTSSMRPYAFASSGLMK